MSRPGPPTQRTHPRQPLADAANTPGRYPGTQQPAASWCCTAHARDRGHPSHSLLGSIGDRVRCRSKGEVVLMDEVLDACTANPGRAGWLAGFHFPISFALATPTFHLTYSPYFLIGLTQADLLHEERGRALSLPTYRDIHSYPSPGQTRTKPTRRARRRLAHLIPPTTPLHPSHPSHRSASPHPARPTASHLSALHARPAKPRSALLPWPPHLLAVRLSTRSGGHIAFQTLPDRNLVRSRAAARPFARRPLAGVARPPGVRLSVRRSRFDSPSQTGAGAGRRAAFLHGWAAAQTAASAAGGVSRGPRHWLNGLMLRLLVRVSEFRDSLGFWRARIFFMLPACSAFPCLPPAAKTTRPAGLSQHDWKNSRKWRKEDEGDRRERKGHRGAVTFER
ncbi:hypothetical protein HDK64DRAFT_253195 [Phyllosticta capitalensis]